MLRFIFNLLIALIILYLFGFYVYERLGNSYSQTKFFRIDGAIQSLMASLLFVTIVFFLIKPSINISSVFAEIPTGVDNSKTPHLRIKIVNYSLFKAYDVQLKVFEKKNISISGADISWNLIGHYEGAKTGVGYMQSALWAILEKEKTNAVQFRMKKVMGDTENADEKIKEILNSEASYIEIHASVRHGLSGLQGTEIRRFHNITCVKHGIYEHGFSTKIANNKKIKRNFRLIY